MRPLRGHGLLLRGLLLHHRGQGQPRPGSPGKPGGLPQPLRPPRPRPPRHADSAHWFPPPPSRDPSPSRPPRRTLRVPARRPRIAKGGTHRGSRISSPSAADDGPPRRTGGPTSRDRASPSPPPRRFRAREPQEVGAADPLSFVSAMVPARRPALASPQPASTDGPSGTSGKTRSRAPPREFCPTTPSPIPGGAGGFCENQ